MKLLKASGKIVGGCGYSEAVRIIATAAGMCYNITPADSAMEEFIRKRMKAGHESVIEHASVTCSFEVDRGVTHEMVRHRLCSFTQSSTRYCDYDGEREDYHVKFIIPFWCKNIEPGFYTSEGMGLEKIWASEENLPEDEWVWLNSMRHAECTYKKLRILGWVPEKARAILPNSTMARIVWTANLREWRHILRLRALGTTGRPHPQMVEIMAPVLESFRANYPVFFEDL